MKTITEAVELIRVLGLWPWLVGSTLLAVCTGAFTYWIRPVCPECGKKATPIETYAGIIYVCKKCSRVIERG